MNKTTSGVLVIALLGALSSSVVADQYVAHATLAYHGPVAYVDKKLQITVYAETDGKHLRERRSRPSRSNRRSSASWI